MRIPVRWAIACAVGCLMTCGCLAGFSASSVALASEAGAGEGGGLLGNPLVVPALAPLDGGRAVAAERLASRLSPEGRAVRSASRTRFSGLGAARAVALARIAYPHLVDAPAYGAPRLPAGQRIVSYPNDHAARVQLPNGGHAVLDSLLPLLTHTPSGGQVPVDLGLRDTGGAFEPAHPIAGLRIPRHVRDGVSLLGRGLSLTPVDGHGRPLGGGEGTIDGSTVLYPNTQTDADTLVKPLALGVESDTLLRSQDSPERLFFKLGLPRGARLISEQDGSLRVATPSRTLAIVPRPSAQDAQGGAVPVSMSVSGDTLALTVRHRAGDYAYPIVLDPTVIDHGLTLAGEGVAGNWAFFTEWPTAFVAAVSAQLVGLSGSTAYSSGQFSFFEYPTQGESRIYGFISHVGEDQYLFEPTMRNKLALWTKAGVAEKVETLTPHTAMTDWPEVTVCILAACAVAPVASEGGIHEGNSAIFEQEAFATGEFYQSIIYSTSVEINQETGPAVSVDTADATVGGQLNGLHTGSWGSGSLAKIGLIANDPGIGVSESYFHSPQAAGWGHAFAAVPNCVGVQCDECWDLAARCTAGHSTSGEPLGYSLNGLPDGVDTIEAKVKNAAGQTATVSTSVSMDSTVPYGLSITGLPASHEIGEGQYHLRASASDGSGSLQSSGVASITFKLSGKEIGTPTGSCSPGPCTTTSNEWVLSGSEFGAGRQLLVVAVTDGAGNVTKEEIPIVVHHAAPLSAGPGSVEPVTGELNLNTTDVMMGAAGASLTVSRVYESRHLTEGVEGPLGPQWSLTLDSQEDIAKQPDGSMLLTTSGGGQTLFQSNGAGGFTSPPGDAGLALSEKVVGASHLLLLSSRGSVTTFAHSAGAGELVWVPTVNESSGGTNTTTTSYQTVSGITEPTQVLAPVPANVNCTTIVKGCRALLFTYATSTTASSEAPAGWGDYLGRLKRVDFKAWDPATSALLTTAVAQYSYDSLGRLRAEWDPRISPNLKTTYGYDSEGHVTASSTSGQQPWLFTYGEIKTDSNTGRLLSLARPAAATALGNESVLVNTVVPTLSTTTPVLGTSLSVSSNGTWSNAPLRYSYQWQDCASGGTGCVPIPGATNQSYTPLATDAGYALVVQVRATSAAGTVAASTAASSVVPINSTPGYSASYGTPGSGNGQFSSPARIALDSAGNIWVTDTGQNRIEKFTSAGVFSAAYGTAGSGNGQFSTPVGIAIDSSNNVYVSDQGNSRIEELNSSGTFVRAWGTAGSGKGQFNTPAGLAFDSQGYLWVADSANNRVQEFSGTGLYMSSFGSLGSGNGQLSAPASVAIDQGNVYVADSANNRVEEFSPLGAYINKWGTLGTGNSQFNAPKGIATDPTSGALYVSDTGNTRVQMFNPAGTYLTKFGVAGIGAGQFLEPTGVVAGSGTIFVVDTVNNRFAKWTHSYPATTQPAAPSPGTTAVWTFAYRVPVTGTGRPYALGSTEVAAWAQTDLPTDATAIFPPDKAVASPPLNYSRATVYYQDDNDRLVNVAKPDGSIATSEYNSYNDVVRTLTPGNRVTALAAGAGSAAQSQLIDTQSTYGSEGTELLSTLAPLHTVKLANGSSVSARQHVQYSYDEGAPAGGPYRLVTKMTEGAQIAEQPEADVRTTITSFSGQRNLGWLLRKPTSTTADPGGLELRHTTTYDSVTGNVTEARTPGASNEEWGYSFKSSFGTFGTGNGQFHGPAMDAVDAAGNVWVTDSANNRFEKFSSTGAFIAAYGSAGSGNGQFLYVGGIAINQSSGNVYVSDEGNSRIEEFSSTGEFVRTFGTEGSENGQFEHPVGMAIDSSGNVFIADYYNNRVQKFSSTGTYLSKFGTVGSGNGQLSHPTDVEIAGGNLYVVDYGNNRVQEFTTAGSYLGQFGTSGTKGGQFTEPEGIALEPTSGNLYVTDTGNGRIEEFSPAGMFIEAMGSYGSGAGQFVDPNGIAFNAAGNMYVVDYGNNRVQMWAPVWAPTYTSKYGSLGSGNGQLSKPGGMTVDAGGNVWVADTENNRVEEFNSSGTFVRAFGTLGTGNGNLKKPRGVGLDSSGDVWVADTENNRIEEFSSTGTFMQVFGTLGTGAGQFNHPTGIAFSLATGMMYILDTGNNRVQGCITYLCFTSFGSAGSGNGQFNAAEGLAIDSSGNFWIADGGNNRVQELSSTGTFIQKFGTLGSGNGQFSKPEGLSLDAEDNVWVADGGNSRVQEFSSGGAYMLQLGVKGSEDQQFNTPASVAFTKTSDFYVLDTLNNRIQKWRVAPAHESTTNGGTHGRQTVYYTAGTNTQVAACGSHPEWANLPCQSQPAVQPETAGVPNLPVTKYTYNMWDEVLTTVDTVGASTHTTTNTYDGGGRLQTTGISSTVGTALPTVTNEYNTSTGALVKRSATIEGSTKSLTSVFNTLGEMTSYTDADSNAAAYTYDIDGRLSTANDGKGTQTSTYDTTSGELTSLVDTAAGTFTATYNAEGAIASSVYPNGMTATYAYNATGEAVGLEYVKTTHCVSACTWFTDSVTPSIHNQWLSQASSLSSQTYAYDNVGRLSETQDTPAAAGCTTRVYTYDPDTDRTSLITRAPGAGGVCVSTGGTTQTSTYDTADRLLDTGIAYSTFGNITSLPAADAGGTLLTSGYYVDNQLATQTQNGQTIGYNLDPAFRTRQTVATGTTTATTTYHYADGAGSPAWTVEPTSGHWTREIGGIDGALVATQYNGEAPVLQLANLHGDIVATVALSELATGLTSSGDSTEYGVPRTGSPAKFSWLGAGGLQTELASGVIAMGARSYVPQLGRFMQPDPVAGGGPNSYAYTNADPVNESDPMGEYSATISSAIAEGIFEEAAEIAAQQAAEEAAARAAAEAAASAAESEGEAYSGQVPEGGEPYEAWGEVVGHSAFGVGSPAAGGGGVRAHAAGKVCVSSSGKKCHKEVHYAHPQKDGPPAPQKDGPPAPKKKKKKKAKKSDCPDGEREYHTKLGTICALSLAQALAGGDDPMSDPGVAY